MRGVAAIALAITTGCGFKPAPSMADAGDDPIREDAPPGTLLWRMDSELELGVGASVDGAFVHPRGVVEPEAYATGVLRLRSSNDQLFLDPNAASWDELEAVTPVRTALGQLLPFDRLGVLPGGMGIDDLFWTLWGDGEIYLEAGMHGFALRADDAGFLDIYSAEAAAYQRVVVATWNGGQATGTFVAPAAGWYPVRVGLSQGDGSAFFDLSIDVDGAPPIRPITSGRWRAPAAALVGPLVTVTDEPFEIRIAGQTVGSAPMIDENWGSGAPAGMGLSSWPPDNFSVRYEGQFRIDVAGDYTFTVDSDDGHRLAIDGQPLLESWTTGTPMATTSPIQLAIGWHDLALDYFEAGGDARISLIVASGPDTTLVGAALPLDRVRPVTGAGERSLPSSMMIASPIGPDANVDLVLTLPENAGRVTRVDVGVVVSHPNNWGDVELRLTPPGGTARTFYADQPPPPGATTGAWVYGSLVAGGSDNWTVDGTWRLRFDDDEGPNDGSLTEYHVTPHFTGGPDVVTRQATWTSVVHGFGEPVAIDNVNWSAVVGGGGGMVGIDVEVRTCMAVCTDEPWVAVPEPGATPDVAPGTHAQVRALLRSDGSATTWLDWVDVLAVPQ